MPDDKKIIFTGLDNGGKTSIITALQESIEKVMSLKPTTGVERSTFKFLDYEIHAHDLGGQKKYRIKYIKQPDKYFAETDICIYVVDIQDIGRYEESLSYFVDLLKLFKDLDMKPLLYIFFHKAEKVLLENDKEEEKNIEMLTAKFIEATGGNFDIEIKITTIYDIWSISSSFASIMHKIYPPSELVVRTMKELADNVGADCAVLFDEHVLMLAHYAKNELYNTLVQYTAPYFFTFKNFEEKFEGKIATDKMRLEIDQYDFLFLENKKHQPRLFLLLIGKHGTLPEKDELGKISDAIPELFINLGINLD